jgi:hypothetical protein
MMLCFKNSVKPSASGAGAPETLIPVAKRFYQIKYAAINLSTTNVMFELFR